MWIIIYFYFSGTLKQQEGSSDWGKEVKEILNQGINRPKSGHDAGKQCQLYFRCITNITDTSEYINIRIERIF